MIRRLAAPTVAAAMLLSCDGSATGPSNDLCGVRAGIEVCVDRSEYGINQSITITMRNRSDSPVYKDWCGTTTSRVKDAEDESRPRYNPGRRCRGRSTIADIVGRAARVDPGESMQDVIAIGGHVVQGFYRANVWLLDADGTPAFDAPISSGMFSIFPSQN